MEVTDGVLNWNDAGVFVFPVRAGGWTCPVGEVTHGSCTWTALGCMRNEERVLLISLATLRPRYGRHTNQEGGDQAPRTFTLTSISNYQLRYQLGDMSHAFYVSLTRVRVLD